MKSFLLFILLAVIITGCGNDQPNSSPVTNRSSHFEEAPTRALGASAWGDILIVPAYEEQIEELGAPSCLGAETDLTFKSEYFVVFRNELGEEETIGEVPGPIVSGSENPIKLDKRVMDQAELFFFQPIKNKCRSDTAYFYVVEDNTAFQASFKIDNEVSDKFHLAPGKSPYIDDGALVIESFDGEFPSAFYFTRVEDTFILRDKKTIQG